MYLQEAVRHFAGIIAGLGLGREHRGRARALQLAQLMLVQIPANDIGRVEDACCECGAIQPVEKFIQARRIIPDGPDHGQCKSRPVYFRVIPIDDGDA